MFSYTALQRTTLSKKTVFTEATTADSNTGISWEINEIFQNINFEEHLQTTAPVFI